MTETIPTIKISATYDCVYWLDGVEDPIEWGGFCDPCNPYGTADSIYREGRLSGEDDEPIIVELPLPDALTLLRNFPGGIWGFSEVDPEQTINGAWTRVYAHLDDSQEELMFELLEMIGMS